MSQLEMIPEAGEEPSSNGATSNKGAAKRTPPAKKRRNYFRYYKTIVAVTSVAILGMVYGVTRPVVVDFAHTVQIYFTPGLQKKAWNEAKRQYLERDIESNKHQIEELQKQSFYKPVIVPVAHAAETTPTATDTTAQVAPEQKPEIQTPGFSGVSKPTAAKLRAYLESKGSPLADYAEVILEQEHWVKILSVSNAESSMCKRVDPVHWTNCWGIMKPSGGLRSMGANLGAAVKAANQFIDTNPRGAKYGDRTIEQMNGTWNQPGTKTWVANNYTIINELKGL